MTNNYLNLLLGLVLSFSFIGVDCGMTKDKMYETIDGSAACFRRLNGTHQFGCTSERRGSVGVVHIINTTDDIDWLINNSTAGPYMVVITPALFTQSTLLSLKENSGRVAGVVLRNDSSTVPNYYSHEQKCPNDQSALEGTCSVKSLWNPLGTGLFFEDFPFPIFVVTNNTDVQKIVSCFEKFNNYDLINQQFRSLCALELKSFMFATTDTDTCIRRTNIYNNLKPVKFCDPLGDRNIWATLFPRGNYIDNITGEIVVDKKSSKVIVLAARLDDTSMFDGLTPGAISPVSGLVTLLTTAYLLKQMVNTTKLQSNQNVLFLLLNGESYDYIGSQRVLYDMLKDEFPLKYQSDIKYNVPNITVDDISLFIELTQFNDLTNLNTFFMDYYQQNLPAANNINNFINKLNKNIKLTNLKTSIINGTIPPASLQTFLKSNRSIAGVVLADHTSKQFNNNYYHSIYDNAAAIHYHYYNRSDVIASDSIQKYLSQVALTVAHTVYDLLAENTTFMDKLDPPDYLVDELLYCYLISSKCNIFKTVTFQEMLQEKPLSLYVGVDDWLNAITTVTGYTLAYFIGDEVHNKTACRKHPDIPVFNYNWMEGNDTNGTKGICIRSTMNFTRAKSPAFDIEDYDWKSGQYSSWSESTWQDFSFRMFLKPSAQHENITITIGTTVLIISFIIVYFTNKRADILFNLNPNIIGTSC